MKNPRNGPTALETALAQLLQNQAQFVAHIDEDRQRFSRIEKELDVIKAILLRHNEMLEKLPEAIREKIGFQKP
jgi:hypothetical protein